MFQKIIPLIIRRSHIPEKLTIHKFATVSYGSFASVSANDEFSVN